MKLEIEKISVVLSSRTSTRSPGDGPESDVAALASALALAKSCGAKLSALSVVGPLQPGNICQEALDLGCDQSLMLRSLVPVDYLGMAQLLAAVLQERAADLIICGDHYTDNGSTAVSAALSRLLDRPLISGVIGVEHSGEGLQLLSRTDTGTETQECPEDAILAVLDRAGEGRSSLQPAKRKRAKKAVVEEILADGLLLDSSTLLARSALARHTEFSASSLGVELLSEPAELLARMLKDKLWSP